MQIVPVVSKAQNAAMHAAAAGKSTLGIPKKVGAEFVADQKPGDVKNLPERKSDQVSPTNKKVAYLKKHGLISEKAAANRFKVK